MSKLWRCYNCPKDDGIHFEEWQGLPKCPKCGLTLTSVGGGNIVERKAIHYVPPHEVLKNRGSDHRICDGRPSRGGMATAEVQAVTCPDCLKNATVQQMLQEQGVLTVVPDADFIVTGGATDHGS